MNKQLTLLFGALLFCTLSFQAQTKDHVFQAMDNLVGGTWKLDGFWMNGKKFSQEFTVTKFGDGIYEVETIGNTSATGYAKGLRNKG
ncbi:MAG: hypothetical protein HKN32_00750, partial [Flavobacteriales bacterium]|nr:hypothetical protein [Flavobacteriales bacterium]